MSELSEVKEWEAAPYDGLRGMPPDWVPEEFVIRFMANRLEIENEILKNKSSISAAFSRLKFYIKKEEFWRREDELRELHHDEEALKITNLINNLKFPKPSNLDYVFDDLAKFHEDIKLGEGACLNRWLGKDIAQNNLVGKTQRKRRVEGGIKSGKKRRYDSRHDDVINLARRLRQSGEPRWGLASRIKYDGSFSFTVRQINYILKKSEIK